MTARFDGEPPPASRRQHLLKVILGASALILIAVGAWLAATFYYLSRADRANGVRLTVNRIRIEELEARRCEKDFLLRSLDDPEFHATGASVYLTRHRERIAALIDEIERLHGLAAPSSRAEIDELRQRVQTYDREFRRLTEACRRQGFGTFGLAGARLSAARALREEIEKVSGPVPDAAFRDWALRESPHRSAEDAGALASLEAAYTKLHESLTSRFNGALPESLSAPAAAYRAALTSCLLVQEEIGITEDAGLEGKLRHAIHDVEPLLERIFDNAVAADEKARRDLVMALLVAGAIMAALFGVSLFFAQSAHLRARQLLSMNAAMLEDIEARRRAEERFRTILESAPDAMVITDGSGGIVLVNHRTEALFLYEARELLGRSVDVLFSRRQDGGDGRLAGGDSRLASGHERHGGVELQGRRKDGTAIPIELSSGPLDTHEGRLVLHAIRDITERRKVEEALAEKNRQLFQSERLAAIGTMVTGLAHESRNALQRSQACLEMLAHRVDGDARAGELVERIQDAQNHLHRLYEQVREYAAPIRLDKSLVELPAVLESAWSSLAIPRSEREAALLQERGAADLRCHADAFAIEEVFRNVLDNSLDACEDPVEIRVEWSETSLDGRRALRAAVIDNGPGIRPEHRARLFEPFYSTKTKGTGLGLAISRRLVEAHGGRIDLGPERERGAEIIIVLPAEPPAAEQRWTGPPGRGKSAGNPEAAGGKERRS
jgi:PAS domain S-box-containing protein